MSGGAGGGAAGSWFVCPCPDPPPSPAPPNLPSECEWKSRISDGAGRGGGIRRCDRNGTVVEISLYNELTGPIPSELGRLWNLRTL